MKIDRFKHLASYGTAVLFLLALTTLVLLLAGSGSADDMRGVILPGEKLPATDRQTQAQVNYQLLPLVGAQAVAIPSEELTLADMAERVDLLLVPQYLPEGYIPERVSFTGPSIVLPGPKISLHYRLPSEPNAWLRIDQLIDETELFAVTGGLRPGILFKGAVGFTGSDPPFQLDEVSMVFAYSHDRGVSVQTSQMSGLNWDTLSLVVRSLQPYSGD